MKKAAPAKNVRASLVVTTIFEPRVLEQYYANFKKFGHLEQVEVILIVDQKTPASARALCDKLSQRGLRCLCPSLEEQEKFLRRIGLDPRMVPYDSDNRRNVGYLMALESGVDFLLSIDDDNYCIDSHDFFLEHAVVTSKPGPQEMVNSTTGFANICELLDWATSVKPYPRGFPYHARHKRENWQIKKGPADIHINAGLWLADPDVDAITWLVSAPQNCGAGSLWRHFFWLFRAGLREASRGIGALRDAPGRSQT